MEMIIRGKFSMKLRATKILITGKNESLSFWRYEGGDVGQGFDNWKYKALEPKN